jgi:hypothetical protein
MNQNRDRSEAGNALLRIVIAVIFLAVGALGWEWHSAHTSHSKRDGMVTHHHRH